MISKVVIVDDDDFTLKIEQDYLKEAIKKNNFSFEIIGTMRNYSELSTFLTKNHEAFLYFMDLDFGDNQFNGIDISNKIRELQPSSKIIFVTSHPEEVFNILKSGISPVGFIAKSIQPNKMVSDFSHYLHLLTHQQSKKSQELSNTDHSSSLSIPIGIDEFVDLPFDKISYIETSVEKAHHIYFHTIDHSKLMCRWSLSEVNKKLPSYFTYSHRSTIVNKKLVTALQRNYLRLSTGDNIPVSRRYIKHFKRG